MPKKNEPQCHYCGETIKIDELSMSMPHYKGKTFTMYEYHCECRNRMQIGGLNHLKGTCKCCGGNDPPDPPEMTKREAAIAACDLWWEQQK